MRELDFINIIKHQIGDKYIGDDCAYLREFGLVISQDSLVENVHFKREWCTAFQLGYKSMAVNISDILASGAKPIYATVALSLPKDINEHFVDEFYKGAKSALLGAEIVGGDITGSNTIFISISVLGSTKGRKISSRKNAKEGYVVITRGDFGKSPKGLQELINAGNNQELIKAHLEPELDETFSSEISTQIKEDYAMMDTSDGLADALFKIAKASNVTIKTDYIEGMFGAEDYKLVAAVPKEFLKQISNYRIIGTVEAKQDCTLMVGNKLYFNYNELGCFNHWQK